MTGHRIDLPEMLVGSKFTGEYIEGGVKLEFRNCSQKIECDKTPTKGHLYLCTNYVEMVGYIAFEAGCIYKSENESCLTNSKGNKFHVMGHPYFGKHFRNA